MSRKSENGKWLDGRGGEHDSRAIDDVKKAEDAAVEKIFQIGVEVESFLLQKKAEVFQTMEEHLAGIGGERYRKRKNWKGSVSLSSFDGMKRVDYAVANVKAYDSRLQLAAEKIREWLDMYKDIPVEVKTIALAALEPRDNGKIDASSFLNLLRGRTFDHPLWKEAKELARESEFLRAKKPSLNLKFRNDPDDLFASLNLNFSTISFQETPGGELDFDPLVIVAPEGQKTEENSGKTGEEQTEKQKKTGIFSKLFA